tara:strand:+ start:2301 stop:3374 length:1074 start_codon:yes stop_codon:yes gene_type:complete
MTNHGHCCCADNATCGYFDIEEYLNTGHGIGCKYIGGIPTGCCGDNGGGDDCSSVDCGSHWNFALEIMIQRTARNSGSGSECEGNWGAHCCQDECGDAGIDCATTYDTQVIVIEADSANWIKDGTGYRQTVSTTLGPYASENECCLSPNGADMAEMCTNADCMEIDRYNCDYPGSSNFPRLENGLIMSYSTSKVNMDDQGLPLEVTFSMTIKNERVECVVESIVGPNGFDDPDQWNAQYDPAFILWAAGVGPGAQSKGTWFQIDWASGAFRCYCNNTTTVDGVVIPWGDTIQLGHTPVNGEDYTTSQYNEWLPGRQPFYTTRHLRCVELGAGEYSGACGNCGPWVDIRCWMGDVYEN